MEDGMIVGLGKEVVQLMSDVVLFPDTPGITVQECCLEIDVTHGPLVGSWKITVEKSA